METNANIKNLVEVGVNKYGQRLDEYSEFGQSLEAEVWYFDGAVDVSVAPLPALECLIRPVQEKMRFATKSMNTRKPVEVGVNKYGQRLDEFNEFGQSLEAEVWYFDGTIDASVAPLPVLECLIRPAQEKTKFAREGMSTRKPVEVGVNKYGQRLDEYNEFGQSLEAEVWYFDSAVDVSDSLVPAFVSMSRPTEEKKPASASSSMPLAAEHLRAA
ncbi:MAG: hypothetical protein PHO83_02060 [Geobacteraceae bacterium]|nr:hypothetical protein [Geobacteraceae bacterium]